MWVWRKVVIGLEVGKRRGRGPNTAWRWISDEDWRLIADLNTHLIKPFVFQAGKNISAPLQRETHSYSRMHPPFHRLRTMEFMGWMIDNSGVCLWHVRADGHLQTSILLIKSLFMVSDFDESRLEWVTWLLCLRGRL